MCKIVVDKCSFKVNFKTRVGECGFKVNFKTAFTNRSFENFLLKIRII